VSFESSARTVRDRSRPLGYRVRAFYQCIESFPPFGFHATRQQLRRIFGVTAGEWTDEQLLQGIDLLEQARRSWVAARDGADVRTHQPEDRYNRPLPEDGVPYGVWLATYFGEPTNAERWGVADLGTCPACSHLLVVHGRSVGCWGCLTSAGVGVERSCRLPSPLLRASLMIPRPR
jgi:hypothetical protein